MEDGKREPTGINGPPRFSVLLSAGCGLRLKAKCNDQPSPADSVARSLARCATRLIKLRGLDGTPTEEAGTALSTALQPRMAWSVTRNLLSSRLR